MTKLLEVIEQLEQLNILEVHELVKWKKALDVISELENKGFKKKLKNEHYCSLVNYIASFIEFTNLASMLLFNLLNGSFESVPSMIIKILIIECIQENLQHKIRKGDHDLTSILEAILIDSPKQIFSSKLPGIAMNATVNACNFLHSNVSFFYRKAVTSSAVRQENSIDLNY